MTRDDDLFADALELPAPERAALLDHECGADAALRARVEALLAAHDIAGNFLVLAPPARRPSRPEEKPGDVIGHYTLVAKIGEGGFGSVYLAEQREPVRRRVAFKIIKLGMDTRAVIARFEGERQALAMMDHPDIARVFDAGATDTGRPFFAMEFVAGAPITKFCDEQQLPVAARLELFARVCLALQHAHQKGIVHRDIKPSNILVALRDGVPAPKVIDFGIAKATQERLTAQTVVTALDQFIGTPAYMSPEQAERRDLDIDTRSDVYSLGVLLYELLTSRLPFDPKSIAHVGVDEIRRMIREVAPPRPSTRIATLAGTDRAAVARLRGAAPLQLSTALRGDLDWIVMRCLEKDRARRYATAQELADDVRRYLRREPVEARPPSTLYRVERFVSRHRLACASVAAIALTLIAGTVISVRQAIRATRAERAANAERDAANAASRAESLARADAQRRQQQAEDLLTFMLGDFRTELQKIGRLQLLDTVGGKAMAYFGGLDPRDLTDTALASQAKALTQIGEIRLDEARYADAIAAFTTAYNRAAALVTRHPANGDMLFERAQAEYWIGYAARLKGDDAECRRWFTRYRDSALALATLEQNSVRARTEVSYGRHNLAALDLDEGHLAAARTGFLAERDVVAALLDQSPDDSQLRYRLADITSWLGTAAERDGDYAGALQDYAEMTDRMNALVVLEPAVARWKTRLAESRIFAGRLQLILGQGAASAATLARARATLDQLVAQDAQNRAWTISSLNCRLLQANLLFAAGDAAAARHELDGTRAKLAMLVEREPSDQVFSRILANAWRLEAGLRLADRRADAGEAIRQALELEEKWIKKASDDATLSEFALSSILAGRIAAAQHATDAAIAHWREAVTVVSPHLDDTHDWRFLDPATQALTLLGRTDEARPLVERLKHFGYHTADPLAAPILDVVVSTANSTKPHE
ncbi:MAG TPA: protein kinase [Opitutus sp.]|nr:protein kinase [Opitutus sp.]